MYNYITEKINVLKQFNIKLSKVDTEHIYRLPTEIAVDNFCRKLIKFKLGVE